MTFKEELEEAAVRLYLRIPYELPIDWRNYITLPEVQEALTSIINLVDKELPKFIDVGKYDLDCPPTDLHHAAGYNQAISDVRKVLGLKDV